ncbi:MAG: HAD family hydrolase [Isosphaeraceae bacterium]
MDLDSDSSWNGLRCVVLDAVGTLIEPFPSVSEAYVTSANRQGIALDRDVVRERFHRAFRKDESSEGLGAWTTDEATEVRRWRRIVAEVLPELPDPDRGFADLWEHFGRPSSWRCFPDVPEFLRRANASRLILRIASNFDGRLRTVIRGLPEVSALADRLWISSEVGRRKPHPEFYQSVIHGLGTSPEAGLWVGDDPENDVLGPRRAGFRSVLLNRVRTVGSVGPSVPDLLTLAEALALR